jgi:hypothetical protein
MSPDGVSVTPAGTPVFVASGHPAVEVVVAKAILPVNSALIGNPTSTHTDNVAQARSRNSKLPCMTFRSGRQQTAFLRRYSGLPEVISRTPARFNGWKENIRAARQLNIRYLDDISILQSHSG